MIFLRHMCTTIKFTISLFENFIFFSIFNPPYYIYSYYLLLDILYIYLLFSPGHPLYTAVIFPLTPCIQLFSPGHPVYSVFIFPLDTIYIYSCYFAPGHPAYTVVIFHWTSCIYNFYFPKPPCIYSCYFPLTPCICSFFFHLDTLYTQLLFFPGHPVCIQSCY